MRPELSGEGGQARRKRGDLIEMNKIMREIDRVNARSFTQAGGIKNQRRQV